MPLAEPTYARVIPAAERHAEPSRPGGEAFVGEGERGIRSASHPGELGATARIARDAVQCVAARCDLPAYGAVALLARRLAVRKAEVRQFTEEGIVAPQLRGAVLDATEEIERRAGGPWSGHVPVTLRRRIPVY